jgi:hypothetical protein
MATRQGLPVLARIWQQLFELPVDFRTEPDEPKLMPASPEPESRSEPLAAELGEACIGTSHQPLSIVCE